VGRGVEKRPSRDPDDRHGNHEKNNGANHGPISDSAS
jgi:hypothetical protein